MKTILMIGVVALAMCGAGKAQTVLVSFDGSSVPSNWQSNSTTALALSSMHVKKGGKALLWQPANGDYLKAIDLAIPSLATGNATSGQAQIFFHLAAPTEDTLLFQFIDSGNVVRRQGKMLLNFKGWREFHRSYAWDYAGTVQQPGFSLVEMRITYLPKNPSNTCTIHIDEATIVGDANVRIPGPQVWPDYAFFRPQVTNAPYLNVLPLWQAGPDIPVTTATAAELSDLAVLRTRFFDVLGSNSGSQLSNAKNYVTNCQIVVNPDGTLNGRGIAAIYNLDTLTAVSNHVTALARAAGVTGGDPDSEAKLILFTRYLLSEGLAEGGRIVIMTNNYPPARSFFVGFLLALPFYPPDLRAEVMAMLKWSSEYSILYGATFTPGYSVDYLNVRTPVLFDIALANPDDNEAVRDVKLLTRFLERNTVPGTGGRDGMKPDGVGYHHGSQHTSYMGAWGKWIEMADSVRGTVFRVSLTAYENMSIGLKYLLTASSKGVLFSHAESGRNPFPAALPVKLGQFQRFVLVGGDIKGVPHDPVMGAYYNTVTGTTVFPDMPAISLDGFSQFNYSALGVQRKRNWVAVMRGFTSKIFGAEIYSAENRYGRYQSYGTVEVLYGGTLDATGYRGFGKGWDWNVMPGTTTVHFPDYAGLQSTKSSPMEFQNNNFAGSLSLGQEGIFGLILDERANGNYDPSRLKAKKSVFAFDTLLICLGSTITAENGRGNVATNIFQGIHQTTLADIYINSTSPTTTNPYDQTFDTDLADLWMVNGQTTGYYVPQGNGTVTVVRGLQSSPREDRAGPPTVFESAYASKAWINHGLNPDSLKYHYVVVPGTTPSAMQALATQLAGGTLYTILKQTDSMHVVKYNPLSLTGYVFFKANTAVNTSHIKSVSNVCIAAVRESNDTITVTVNSPDMNITTETAYNYYWKSNPRNVTLVLNGDWDVAENLSGVTITHQATTATAIFPLVDGFSKTIKLKVPSGARRAGEKTLADSSAFEVVKKEDGKEKTFTVFPNPASKNLEADFTAAKTGAAHIRIFNMQGALLQSKQVAAKQGRNRVSLDVSGLKAGSYIIVLSGTDLHEKGIFIKQ